ncbi:MAG: hypothetical protein KAU48_14900 [Candidatus Thorarchaeota archaeon]|nr:hypothetical protein [Candidatus Thorarchaeota archaeon]
MQLGTEFVIFSSISIVIISAIVGTYLLRLWLRQSNRLLTDLPLVFAITAISLACQTSVVALSTLGIIEPSLAFFKLRSIIISASMIPILGAILQIWAPRIQKYHMKILMGVTAYWLLVVYFGVSESIIMTLTIPLILLVGLMMMVTFIITWKTGRLKEIRSGVMVISLPIIMASQILRVPLLGTSLFYVPDILLVISLIITVFAFVTPAKKSESQKKREEHEAPKQIEMAVEY